MNVPGNVAKSTILASVVYWTIIVSDEFDKDIVPFVMLSYIPIFLCVLVIVLGTIYPFFWAAKNTDFNSKKVFKTCFPYYSIVAFSICSLSIVALDFNIFIIAFCSSAFITVSQSWVWFAKEDIK